MTPAETPRSEFEIIAAIRDAARGPRRADVTLGIGDDGAVLSPPPGHELIFTTDLLVEDRHFRLGEGGASGFDVGWKSLAVSISDVAAMGGRALWAVASVALPAARTGGFTDDLAQGLTACAQHYGVALVGGDTTGTPGPVIVNVALVGAVPTGRAVRRDGARAGDAICVTGALGGSLAGRHLRPNPRQDIALSLVQRCAVHAMIDLSDGLSSDLGHVLDASGVGAQVWADRVPVHDDARLSSATSGRPPLAHALHDGEDFELLFTVDTATARDLVRDGVCATTVSCVGRITAQRDYLLLPSRDADARGEPMGRGGHDHFRPA